MGPGSCRWDPGPNLDSRRHQDAYLPKPNLAALRGGVFLSRLRDSEYRPILAGMESNPIWTYLFAGIVILTYGLYLLRLTKITRQNITDHDPRAPGSIVDRLRAAEESEPSPNDRPTSRNRANTAH